MNHLDASPNPDYATWREANQYSISPSRTPASLASAEGRGMSGNLPLIVVADDNPDILHLVERRLSKRGYEVVTASDGLRALDLIRERHPDAVVLDWLMPEMQGPEVCSLLKEDHATEGIPVVLLTAKASESDVSTGFERGADEYLTKPFEIEELDQTLRRLLST